MPFDSNGNATVTRTIAVTGQTIQAAQVNVPFADIQNMLSATMLRTGVGQATGDLNFGGFKALNLADGANPNDAVTKQQLDAQAATQSMGQRGYLYGLKLSNNAVDPTNDIDISIGAAAQDALTPSVMTLSAGATKRLDAAWVVGTGNGGLDTGAIANATYHVYLIQRSDTGVVDVCFSVSASAPTTGGAIPTAYNRYRRIGSVLRASATIRAFVQDGDYFQLSVPSMDISAVNPGTAAVLRTLSVPVGIRAKAYVNFSINDNLNGAIYGLLSDPLVADSTPSALIKTLAYYTITTGFVTFDTMVDVMTNTSAQIRSRFQFSDANLAVNITTFGWYDMRGRS